VAAVAELAPAVQFIPDFLGVLIGRIGKRPLFFAVVVDGGVRVFEDMPGQDACDTHTFAEVVVVAEVTT